MISEIKRRGRKKLNVTQSQIESIVTDFLERNMFIRDISERHAIGYTRVRDILVAALDTPHIVQYKQSYRLRNGKDARAARSSKIVSITCDLLFRKDLNYSEIGRLNHVSRERVGQIAQQVFEKPVLLLLEIASKSEELLSNCHEIRYRCR